MTTWCVGALPGGQARDGLVAEVARALDAALRQDAAAVAAVSGGPDSVALLHLAREARPDLSITVAHVRHGLRDDSGDARTAAGHATDLGLAFVEERVQVARAGEGLPAAARRARYAALARVVARTDADAVLVGHTADDQAETVLLNVLRGSGLAGLAGMSPVRVVDGLRLVRPLLRLRRADLRAFTGAEGLRTVEDPTNVDPAQRRARARHDVLPALGGLGPDPVGALVRLADLARADAEALDLVAGAQATRLVRQWGPVRAVRRDELATLPDGLAARVVRLVLARVRGGFEGLSADAVGRVLELGAGQSAHVGGAWVTVGGGWLAAVPPHTPALPERRVAVPGQTPLPETGLVLHADEPALPVPPEAGLAALPPGAPGPAWAFAPAAERPFVVRARRPGDRITLAGGTRKVQDVLTDAGVPRAVRDLVPVVAGQDGRVWWVAGVRAGAGPRPGGIRAGTGPRPGGIRLWLAPTTGGLSTEPDIEG